MCDGHKDPASEHPEEFSQRDGGIQNSAALEPDFEAP